MKKITVEYLPKSVVIHSGKESGAKRSRYNHPDVEIYQVGRKSDCHVSEQGQDHAVMTAVRNMGFSVMALSVRRRKVEKTKDTDIRGYGKYIQQELPWKD
jgi:hypothetical protein